ncbi:MAG: polyphosphate polymerase domain-containing protein [Actinomycetota bacterium]
MSTVALFDELAPVSLDELNDRAELTTRRDRKYLVPFDRLPEIIGEVADHARVLEIDGRREFAYDTRYFDSPDLRSFLDTVRRRPVRHKIRTRRYVDSGRNWLEVKCRNRRGITVKHRFEFAEVPAELGERERAIVQDLLGAEVADSGLRGQLETGFVRSTLLLDDDTRFTIDREVGFRLPDDTAARALRHAIVETKTPGKPGIADRALWALGIRPTKVSKYGTGLASLRPELPRNRWARLLHRDDAWAS